MPIRPDLRKFYTAASGWPAVRRRILKRAGGRFDERGRYVGGARCEQCGVPDRTYAVRARGWWLRTDRPCSNCMGRFQFRSLGGLPCDCTGFWVSPTGTETHTPAEHFPVCIRRIVMITLTTAHLNHKPGDDRDENLKALCQWCHLNYDAFAHKETRCLRKDRERPLLQIA